MNHARLIAGREEVTSIPRRHTRWRADSGRAILAALALVLLGLVLHRQVLDYAGPADERRFLDYIIRYLGAYSDIPSLYFRDHLWHHPLPYIGYALEYPVGTGLLIWLLSFVHGSMVAYFLTSALLLGAAALLTVWLIGRFPRGNPWLLALSPTLALYVLLNWDMFGVLLMVAALLLLERRRDGWGGLLLAVAVWTKFFPIVMLPVVVYERLLRGRRWDAAALMVTFGLATIAINGPFALTRGPAGLALRPAWLYFFRFNANRPITPYSANFWNLFGVYGINISTAAINFASGLLLIIGLGTVLLVMTQAAARGAHPRHDLMLPAVVALITWFLFINKIYSPQYSLWLAALLALAGAPPLLAAAFAGVDLLFYATTWTGLYLDIRGFPAGATWVYTQPAWDAMVLRELVMLLIIAWALRRLLRPAETLSVHPD
ncbi:MAG TPA: glycosyltransferase 87 family protein [Thermomicrobiaceae bacterium]|nr:glycosyltransferase 87 family protein [Thermomicrobiaceae bacterium]